MTAIGGSIESVTIRARIFPVAADADGTRKLGGFENTVSPNGDGTARILKSRVQWMLGGLTLECDDDRDDHAFLKEIADGNEFVPITITYVNGVTYQGRGTVSGEFAHSAQSATVAVELSGPGELTQQ